MSNLKDWLTNSLSGKESNVDEAIKITEGLVKYVEEKYEGLEGFRELSVLIEQYIRKTQPNISNDQLFHLNPLTAKLIDLLLSIAVVDKTCHEILRDDSSILSILTLDSGGRYMKQDHTRLLRTLEVISRGLNTSWVAPHVSELAKSILSLLLTTDPGSEDFLYCLRIITNVVFNNRACTTIVIRSPSFPAVMKRLYGLLAMSRSQSNCSREVIAMAFNFGYLTDQTISLRLPVQMENMKHAFLELQAKVEAGVTFESLSSVASSIYYMTLCISTLLERIHREHSESLWKVGNDAKESGSVLIKSVTEEVIGIVFSKIFPKCVQMMRLQKGQVILQSMLLLLKALCPDYVPANVYNDLWDHFVKTLNDISVLTSYKSKIQLDVLEAHLHFVDRISKANPNNFQADSFSYAMNNCQIVLSALPTDLTRNISTIRLMRRLNSLAQLRKGAADNAISAKTSKVLKEETLLNLLNLLLAQTCETGPNIELSTCVVEILNVVSKSKTSTQYIPSLQVENTWRHISNCILNGDQDVINQAITLTSAVGFSANCVSGVSKMLLKMKQNHVNVSKMSPVKSTELPIYPTVIATRGMHKLNSELEAIERTHAEGDIQAFAMDDVLACYKLRNDLHEFELNNLTDQILHLNRTIAHLKTLYEKQAEILAKTTLASAAKDKNFEGLQKQLDATKEKRAELEAKHFKTMALMKKQLDDESAQLELKSKKLAALQEEHAKMKEYCTKLEAGKEEATQATLQLTKEKRKLQERLDEVEKEWKISKQKLATVEGDFKKSEEARKSAEELLEAERRKTEIIQQVLGNRLN